MKRHFRCKGKHEQAYIIGQHMQKWTTGRSPHLCEGAKREYRARELLLREVGQEVRLVLDRVRGERQSDRGGRVVRSRMTRA